jgi:ParB/RepB/Spo0J family partition protein
METIPAMMRHMSDEEVVVFQTIENLQREDVHPLEEAEGYERLMKEFKYSADQLAEQVGKSRAYIYARLKLCALGGAARRAFYGGDNKLSASTALLIARIPVDSLQEQATTEILTWSNGEPMSYRKAAQHIQARYMLRLADA